MALDNVCLGKLPGSCGIFVVAVVVLLSAHGNSKAANEAARSWSQGRCSCLRFPAAAALFLLMEPALYPALVGAAPHRDC